MLFTVSRLSFATLVKNQQELGVSRLFLSFLYQSTDRFSVTLLPRKPKIVQLLHISSTDVNRDFFFVFASPLLILDFVFFFFKCNTLQDCCFSPGCLWSGCSVWCRHSVGYIQSWVCRVDRRGGWPHPVPGGGGVWLPKRPVWGSIFLTASWERRANAELEPTNSAVMMLFLRCGGCRWDASLYGSVACKTTLVRIWLAGTLCLMCRRTSFSKLVRMKASSTDQTLQTVRVQGRWRLSKKSWMLIKSNVTDRFSSTGDDSSCVWRVLQLLCRAIFKATCWPICPNPADVSSSIPTFSLALSALHPSINLTEKQLFFFWSGLVLASPFITALWLGVVLLITPSSSAAWCPLGIHSGLWDPLSSHIYSHGQPLCQWMMLVVFLCPKNKKISAKTSTYLQQKTHLLAQARLGVVSMQRWDSIP